MVLKNFHVPHSWVNPSMLRDPEFPNRIVMIWRMPDKGKHDKVGYMWLDTNFTIVKPKDMIEVQWENHRRMLVAEDPRIFAWNGQLYSIYNTHLTKYKKLFFAPVFYHVPSDMFFIKQRTFHINIEHEMGYYRHQKNWTPFEYCPFCEYKYGVVDANYVRRYRKEKGVTDGLLANASYILTGDYHADIERVLAFEPIDLLPARLFFIYEINPHRIVAVTHANKTSIQSGEYEAEVYANTTYVTKLLPEYEWEYGEMRGGSPALLINSTHFLSFFHSSGRFQQRHVITYYMGAYIFENKPPFGISGMSPEPIVANAMVNESWGWAYKVVDYIIFPMGFVFDDDYIHVSYGKNDKDGWVLTLNKTELLNSLVPVKYELIGASKLDDKNKVIDGSFEHFGSKKETNFEKMQHSHSRRRLRSSQVPFI